MQSPSNLALCLAEVWAFFAEMRKGGPLCGMPSEKCRSEQRLADSSVHCMFGMEIHGDHSEEKDVYLNASYSWSLRNH